MWHWLMSGQLHCTSGWIELEDSRGFITYLAPHYTSTFLFLHVALLVFHTLCWSQETQATYMASKKEYCKYEKGSGRTVEIQCQTLTKNHFQHIYLTKASHGQDHFKRMGIWTLLHDKICGRDFVAIFNLQWICFRKDAIIYLFWVYLNPEIHF